MNSTTEIGLAKSFRRLGWLGFWMQITILSISVGLVIYGLVFDSRGGFGTRGQLAFIEYLCIAGLVLLAFTTVWFYGYTRLAARMADPEGHPTPQGAERIAWIGVVATIANVVFSLIVILFEVTQLFLYFLRAPQAGVPVVQTTAGQASWVSAGDILSLMVLILTMVVEILMVTFCLWLLFRARKAEKDLHSY